MSMILYLRRVTDEELAAIRSDPSRVSSFFFEEGAQERGDLIDFDKAWQAVHFTLCGAEYYTDHDLGALLINGEPVGDEMGYGTAWLIDLERLRTFDAALRALTDDDIRDRFDPQALVNNDIYRFEECLEYPEEALSYIMQGIPALRRFTKRCIDSGSSALAAIS